MPAVIDTRLAVFFALYERNLRVAMDMHPEDYARGVSAEAVAARMRAAAVAGTFNHDGRAFRATCKEVGIPHTRKAILAFLRGD